MTRTRDGIVRVWVAIVGRRGGSRMQGGVSGDLLEVEEFIFYGV